jgi:hypothetical protein
MPTVHKFLYSNSTRSVRSGNTTRPKVPVSCSLSKCTWQEYDTLGVCSHSVQLKASELLSYACLNMTIDWSAHPTGPTKDVPCGQVCGYSINITSSAPTLMSSYTIKNDTRFDPEP